PLRFARGWLLATPCSQKDSPPSYLLSPILTFVRGRHHRTDSPAHREVSDDRHPSRMTRGDEVVEDLVRHGLVEDAAIAEVQHVVLERLELEAQRVGDVGDPNLAEIGESGLGTDGREFLTTNGDLEVALGAGVGKGLERRVRH